jgi:glyoxylase-like metal-dependent hydrolase (beta-lactamase superfamily II)
VSIKYTATHHCISHNSLQQEAGDGSQRKGFRAELVATHIVACAVCFAGQSNAAEDTLFVSKRITPPGEYTAGLDPAAVSTVVISHFHPDHISGLWAKETNAQVFPNAEILMPEVEYKFWTDPALVEKLPEAARGNVKRIQSTFPTWKNIKQYVDGAELVPGVRAVATPGHTVGHMSFLVASGGQQLFIQSDVTGIHQLFVKNPGWFSMFDSDGPKAEATRRAFFDRVIAEKGMIAGYHFGFPNVGTLSKDGSGYAFAAVKA